MLGLSSVHKHQLATISLLYALRIKSSNRCIIKINYEKIIHKFTEDVNGLMLVSISRIHMVLLLNRMSSASLALD
jgi:hypothetical protein